MSKYDFNEKQKKQIKHGLEQGLDVSCYATTAFNWKQMQEIRLGLEDGLDISAYAKPEYSVYQMKEIRLNLWFINKQISDHNC